MKLRSKIMISLLLVSLTALSISSYYLINRSHLDSIAREQERSINEFDFILPALENGVGFASASEDTQKLLLSRYAEYYAKKGIIIMAFRNSEPLYSDFSAISLSAYRNLLSVKKGSKLVQILRSQDRHYIFISGMPADSEDYVIIYARDISGIYRTRTRNISLSALLAAILVALLGFLSYRYSRWITKPLEMLHRGAKSVAQGDYSVRIPDTKDEFHDLGTAFNQMAQAVQAHTSELETRTKELQVFIDDLSHEMNTPITSIQGYSEFLLRANASEEQKQVAAETIKKEAKRMKDIYEKLMLLTFTREQEPVLEQVKLSELFEDIASSFRLQLAEKDITLIVQNDLEKLWMDRTLMQILLSNLIKNSLQALPTGGRISLRAYLSDTKPILEVTDNGYGIPTDKIQEVTKPFYRIDKSRSRKTGGAGLGLSICKSIADLHQAELLITSTEGTGTSIKIVFKD